MRSPWVRGAFLALALAAAVWAVAANRSEAARAVRVLPAWVLAVSLAASFAYVAATMLSWRAIITAAGPLPPRAARRIFYSSQIAKYLPGGVWNVLAAAEMGRDYAVSRRRSVASLLVSAGVSAVTGLLLAAGALLFGPGGLWRSYWWVAPAVPAGILALTPPVLNRIVGAVLKLARRDGLEAPLTWTAPGSWRAARCGSSSSRWAPRRTRRPSSWPSQATRSDGRPASSRSSLPRERAFGRSPWAPCWRARSARARSSSSCSRSG